MGRLAPGTAAFIVLSTTHPAPVPAAELEGEDGFTARSTATTQPAAGAAVTDTDAASGTRDAESTAATGELASTGSRTAGRAELAVNAQLADQVFSLDAVGPVTSTISQLSRVVAIPDAGESTLLASFGGLNPSGGAINTDVALDFFLPPTLLEITDNVERVVLGPGPGGQPVVLDAVGGSLTARVSARPYATAARLFSLDNQSVSCNLRVESRRCSSRRRRSPATSAAMRRAR